MGTHNICLYKEVDKKVTGYNLKTMELLDCALIGVCAVIRSNTVYRKDRYWVLVRSAFLGGLLMSTHIIFVCPCHSMEKAYSVTRDPLLVHMFPTGVSNLHLSFSGRGISSFEKK